MNDDKIPYYQTPSDKKQEKLQKQPTPIPLRASRKPEPITFPTPEIKPFPPRPRAMNIDEDKLRAFIHQAITKALYAIGNYDPEPNIATMSYEQFEAFMARVWEDNE